MDKIGDERLASLANAYEKMGFENTYGEIAAAFRELQERRAADGLKVPDNIKNIKERIQKIHTESKEALIQDCLKILELSKKKPSTDFVWDKMEIEEDGYIYVRQGAYLGETMINLGDTYEGSGEDCLFIQEALRVVTKLAGHILEQEGIVP